MDQFAHDMPAPNARGDLMGEVIRLRAKQAYYDHACDFMSEALRNLSNLGAEISRELSRICERMGDGRG